MPYQRTPFQNFEFQGANFFCAFYSNHIKHQLARSMSNSNNNNSNNKCSQCPNSVTVGSLSGLCHSCQTTAKLPDTVPVKEEIEGRGKRFWIGSLFDVEQFFQDFFRCFKLFSFESGVIFHSIVSPSVKFLNDIFIETQSFWL